MIVDKPEQIIGMDDPRYAPTWRMYRRAFEPLRVRAAQRHVLRVDEFHGGMTAPEIDKYLAVEGDQVVGLSWFTNHLDVVDLIEPEFFRARFPEQYAAGRIWYVMFACTDGRPGAFWGLIRAMFTAAGPGAVVVMDTCRFVDGQGMPTSTRVKVGSWDAGVRLVDLDAQTFRAFVLSEPPAEADGHVVADGG